MSNESKNESNDESNDKSNNKSDSKQQDFSKILKDFLNDLLTTFPELKIDLHKNLQNILDDNGGSSEVYRYCMEHYPERFFDILYQNEDIYKDDTINTTFLPGIDFSTLWTCDVSLQTRETIWKYLQLILFTVVTDSRHDNFGDTSKFFEAIDQDEFKKKLEETVKQMEDLFGSDSTNINDASGINLNDLPNPEHIHDHISGMMEGKLGNLAKEIAEETAAELNMDSIESVDDVFQKLFKNPIKLMNLVKNVGSKLEEKIKSGEINESELLEEASNMIQKMKNMPGMGDLGGLLSKMGMGGGKVNMNAVQSHLNQNLKQAKMRDRMRTKLAQRESESESGKKETDCQEELVFSTGEEVKRSKKGGKKKRRKNNKNKNKNK